MSATASIIFSMDICALWAVILAVAAYSVPAWRPVRRLLLEQELFLRPQLTLPEVAELLHTNKTYLSKVVNDHYKISFPELINTLRIDYAEQYILAHREARQEEIARACGFSSASSFNITFKKVAGMPPKQWVTNWDASHRD